MPICKNCGSRIDKFNKDRCPICGVQHPFDGMECKTIEITTSIDVNDLNFKPRRKSVLMLLWATLGIFGVPFFYIYKFTAGMIALVLEIATIVGISLAFGFALFNNLGLGFLVGFIILICINISIGFVLLHTPNLKDGRGEFII